MARISRALAVETEEIEVRLKQLQAKNPDLEIEIFKSPVDGLYHISIDPRLGYIMEDEVYLDVADTRREAEHAVESFVTHPDFWITESVTDHPIDWHPNRCVN